MIDPDRLRKIVAGIKVGDKPVKKPPKPWSRTPTNARACACGETVFAYTSLFWIAIVDAEDGHWLRDYKWSAGGKRLDGVFYARSRRYYCETGNSAALHHAITGHIHDQLNHVNSNGHDCRKVNLRPCTNDENQRKRRHYSNSTSKHKGIWLRRVNRWSALIKVDGKQIYLRTYGFEFSQPSHIIYMLHICMGSLQDLTVSRSTSTTSRERSVRCGVSNCWGQAEREAQIINPTTRAWQRNAE